MDVKLEVPCGRPSVGVDVVLVLAGVIRDDVRESVKFQRQHGFGKSLVRHTDDDARHAPKLPAPTDHLDGDVLPLENVCDAEDGLILPCQADHQELSLIHI